jgi:transposase
MTTPDALQRKIHELEARLEQQDALLQQKDAVLETQEAELRQQNAALEQQDALLTELQQKSAAQQLEIAMLLKELFGRKSERYIEDPKQLKLDFGVDDEQVDDAVDGLVQAVEESGREIAVPAHTRRRKKPRNEQLPENLPRYEVTADVPESERQCDEHGVKTIIGYDTTETLEYERPKLRVRVTKYPKYACCHAPDCGITQAPRTQGLVEGNRYDSSVAAEIVTAKYGYHLPVYRQQDLFAGCGWTPSRSTLLNVMTATATLIRPLVEFFADAVRKDAVIGTDDTGVRLIIPKTIPAVDSDDPTSQRVHAVFSRAIADGKSVVNAKMWAYRGVHVPLNVFDFSVSRHRDGPDRFLIDNNYEGVLLGDCYSGYTGISLRSDAAISHAACSAHARRKVFEARQNHPTHASRLLAMFQELYDIEAEAKGDLRLCARLRQEKSQPVWSRLREYLDDSMRCVLPKESMGQAVGYLNNQWTALTRHLEDARIPCDNNDCEQLMKQIAVGRKNWLFIGSVAAGHRAADLMTLVSSALRNDLDVWAYVKGVIDALLSGETNYSVLRPDLWAAFHPEHIRQYRVEERRDRADRKQRRRTARNMNSSHPH